MAETKKIPCRVCGKLFTPCAYCQTHADVFRWRNFACSIECAQKYIADTLAYRAASKNKFAEPLAEAEPVTTNVFEENVEQTITTKKKSKKKNSTEIIETEIENKETE